MGLRKPKRAQSGLVWGQAEREQSFSGVGKPVELIYEYRAPWLLRLDRRQVLELLRLMRTLAGLDDYRIELWLICDHAIAALNKEFLDCAGPTNIITFPPDDVLPGSMHLSLDTLQRESVLYGQSSEHHFIRLLAHGFGHLAGYNHGAEMSVLEQELADAAMCINWMREIQ